MYQRFLNTNDYISIITEEALGQLIRGNEDRLAMAEEAAEQSVIEYLTINYEVERELEIGKRLVSYNPRITYPAGAHFYDTEGRVVEAIRTINGVKAPESSPYWVEHIEPVGEKDCVRQYTQRHNYSPGDLVMFGTGHIYRCVEYNGPDFDDIRVPGVRAWERLTVDPWEPNVAYEQWTVVSFDDNYFTLLSAEKDVDLTIDPMESDDWGMIGEYDEKYQYELSPHEYVVFKGGVYYPVMNPNADEVLLNANIKNHDPRNPNLKKHLLRLSLYELHKLISPANISSSRITDYETSILWLRDASRLKLNPGIPRKLARDKRPVTDFATATYTRRYDPYENMWHV